MSKWSSLPVLVLALAAALSLGTGPTEAGASRDQFTALDGECSMTAGTEWVSGNVLHIRGEVDNKQIASSDPRVNGGEQATVNIDLNLTTGSGSGWGTVVIKPDTIDGSWTGSFSGPITANVFAGRAVAQGSGVLRDLKVMAHFQEIPVPANQPCAPTPALDADTIVGTILSPQ